MEAGWQKGTHSASVSASHQVLEARIAEWAVRQKHLLTRQQLMTAGLSATGIRSRVGRGRLFRIHNGVYATHPPPFSREQRWLAAVLACGAGSLLSDWPAAAHWDITREARSLAPEVTSQSGNGRSRAGITVHRRGPIDPRDVRRKDGIPICSVDLVLVQLAPQVEEAELEMMLVAADSLRLLKRHRLLELLADRRGLPGTGRLLSLLAMEPAIVRSKLEPVVLPICRAAGLPRPLVNHPIHLAGRDRPLTVDFAWPEIRLVVEADSQRFHGDWVQAEIDRERDQLLALEGWLCHRFVRRKLVEDPAGQAERLRRLHHVRARAIG